MLSRASLLVVFSACLLAQSQGERPAFKSGVDVVQIDVSVLDGKRRPVRGLTSKDFTVLEDGKPRDVVAFTPVDLPARTTAPAAGAAAWTRDVAPDAVTNDVPSEGRLVVIVFDWSIRFDDSTLARKIARATVNDLGPGDEAAIVFTSEFANAGIPQNFTSNRSLLLRTIDEPMAFAMKGEDSISPKAGGFINANGQLIMDPYGYGSGGCLCRVCTLDTMTRVADALRGAPGRRKVMIFIGTLFRGFEPAMVAPREAMRGLPPPPVVSMSVPAMFGPGSCSQPLKEARERMSRAAGLANMTIHVVDPVGLETLMNSPFGGASPDTIQERLANLHQPADMTGGRTVLNTNAPETAVPAILDESQSYYLLGFSASDPSGTKLHRIEVKVNRPGVQVRTRTGYVGNDEAVARSGTAPDAPLTTAVSGVLPDTDIPLALVAAPFATPGKMTGTVAVTLGVQARDAAARPGPETLHVVVAALDPKARLIASREETAVIGVNAASGYDLLSRLELAPGRYEIRVATDAPSGRRGSVFTFVDVPNFSRDDLTLTGVALGTSPATPVAPADLLKDLMPVVPTARRTFARVEQVSAFARVQQGGNRSEPVTIVGHIVDRDGHVVRDDTRTFASDRFGASRTADYQLDLRVADLTPGDYLLSIEATSRKKSQRRNVRFSIR
ncbi:MAG TPA: VWA domain-containing protein [Vicinamibacterales bacterium]|nr:VWA domain-containing protein [Vicinamibacterales bacterium]